MDTHAQGVCLSELVWRVVVRVGVVIAVVVAATSALEAAKCRRQSASRMQVTCRLASMHLSPLASNLSNAIERHCFVHAQHVKSHHNC
jgi:hypothetical protein